MRRREHDGGHQLQCWLTIPFSILKIRTKLKIISLLQSGSNEIVLQTYWVLKKNRPNTGAAD